MKLSVSLGVLLMSLAPLVAQEVASKSYLLAKEGAPLPAGRTFLRKNGVSMTDAKMSLLAGERVIEGAMTNNDAEGRVIEFVDQGKIRIAVRQSASKTTIKVGNGPAMPQERVKATEGKVFLLEKIDGKWSAKIEKGEIAKEQEEEIQREVKELEARYNDNFDTQIYGTEPRKIGERWKVNPRFVPLVGGLEVKEGECSMEFKEVKLIQGEAFAVLGMTYDIKTVSEEADQKGTTLHFIGSGELVRSLSLLMDYQFEGEAKVKIEGMLPIQPGLQVMMKVDGISKFSSQLTEMKEEE